ncbi:uncharacterized protein [Nicotiana tomentosiformis]|uniref:uncharacterized protein n=1 Tax=Nicotiana tomentosiformis TaxID=4098 RepID=UPI00388C5A0B
MSLNDSYSQARSQILMMNPLPTVNQAYAMLMSDESQRAVAASAGVLGPPPTMNANTYDFTALYSAKSNSNPKFRENYNVQCEFYKIKGISKENCYNIIGYPSDYKFKKKGGASAHNVMIEHGYSMPLYIDSTSQYMSMQSLPMNYGHHHAMGKVAEKYQVQGNSGSQVQANSAASQVQGAINAKSSSQGGGFSFTKEQYEQIMLILNNNHNGTSSSTSQANVAGTTIALLASSSPQEWIIDTGATNHMDLFSDRKHGIIHQKTCAYTPQQNRVAERKYMHILEVTRALRFQAHIPIKYWGHSVLATIYIINRMPTYVLNGLSPFELLYGQKPTVEHLRVLGCLCYAKKVQETDKLLPRSKPTILMGFSDTQKGYVLLDLATNCFFINKDVSFREDIFPFKESQSSPMLVDNWQKSTEDRPIRGDRYRLRLIFLII